MCSIVQQHEVPGQHFAGQPGECGRPADRGTTTARRSAARPQAARLQPDGATARRRRRDHRLTLIGVVNLEMPWPAAAATAGALGVVTVGLRLARRPRPAAVAVVTQETALIFALFALWQFAGSFTVLGPGGALARSRWIWNLERAVHLPSEAALQRLLLPHRLIIQLLNLYYAGLHFPVLIACMIWLFVAYRDRYVRMRTTLVAFTAACLLIQLIPVAPPRMLPLTGMVDTAAVYGQSVYSAHSGFDPDQLSAMPSVHVGWALLVAIAVIGAARSRWRWLVLLYPAMTALAVVVTANHFWLDGIVAALLLAAVLAIQSSGRRLLAAHADSRLYPARPTWDHRDDSDRDDSDPAGTAVSIGKSSAPDMETDE
jgi:hypothetical protein